MSEKQGIVAHIKTLFLREHVLHTLKVVTLVAYQCGQGYGISGTSAEIIRRACFRHKRKKLGNDMYRYRIYQDKKRGKRIAVDETMLKETLRYCKGKPRVFTYDGSFYGSALRILRLKQTIVCFGPIMSDTNN